MSSAEPRPPDVDADEASRVRRLRSVAAPAVSLSPTPTVAVTVGGTIVCAGEALARLVGVDAEDLAGRRWPDAIVADGDRATAADLLAASPTTMTDEGRTVTIRTGDGATIAVEWWARGVSDDDGAALGVLLVGVDVTDRVLAETARRREAFQLDHAQRLARVGTSLVDVRSGVVTYSDEVYRILELERSAHDNPIELLPELAHPADLAAVQAALDAIFRDQTPLDLVCRAVLPSGRLKHIRMQGRAILDDAGEVEYIVGAVYDVTDQRLTEIELNDTLDRIEHAQSLADLATWTRDLDTRRLKISDQMIELFEMSRVDLEQNGKSFERVHPADRREMEDIVRGLYERHVPYDRPARLLMPDGRVKHVRATGKIVTDAAGHAVSAVGAIQDVSREVEAANRLRATAALLQEAESLAQVGSWEYRVDTGAISWSNGLYRIFEIDPMTEARLGRFLALVHPDDLSATIAWYEQSVKDRAAYDFVHRLLMPDGRLKWVRQHGQVRFDADGGHVLSFGTVQDITRTHIAELEVRDLNAELERRIEERTEELYKALQSAEAASRAKSSFLASMSHELRTPLNAVMGYAQLMELDGRLPGDLHENVAVIRQAGQQLLRLIGDVIDLARVESGHVDLEMVWAPVAELLDACVAQARPGASARGVTIVIEPPVHGLRINGDRLRLMQVLNNLVSNAIKYNVPGGEVALSASLDGGDARITVADTGIGFDPARGAELFEPFNRLGQEMGPAEGTGIGLSISSRLMREMAGEIGFESEPHRGSSFWIQLPGRVDSVDEIPSPRFG